jgi:hypothetical protein
VAVQADILAVDHRQAAQLGEPVRAAEPVAERRRCAEAVAGLVQGQHRMAAARQLEGEGRLGLPGIDVAVDGQDARYGMRGAGTGRQIEQGAQGLAAGAGEAQVRHADPAVLRLDPVGHVAAGKDGQRADERQCGCQMPGAHRVSDLRPQARKISRR